MRRGKVVAGWTRIGENEFKAAILSATKTEPDLCNRLQHAIKATASRRGVRREVRDQYLRWIAEVESAITAMAEAERPRGRGPSPYHRRRRSNEAKTQEEHAMSESAFYAEQVEAFREQYPTKDGWEVYIVSTGYILAELPDFLHARGGCEGRNLDLIREVRVESQRTGAEDRRISKLKTTGWDGDIELRWQEQTLHIRYVYVAGGYLSDRSVILVATKSEATLESLCQELLDFYHDQEAADDSIKVVNGSNMDRPEASWEDICLPNGMIEDIRLATETFFKSKERYRKLNLAYRRGFLFCGPPGCGKTSMARVIAATQPVSCVAYIPKDASNESDQLDRAFIMAEDLAPAILILEDLDKFGHNLPISHLLNRLDGLNSPRGVLVIGTTNEPEKLDPALSLRPSRFDRVWTFPLPDFRQRLDYLTRKGQGLFRENTLHEIAKLSPGFSVAYLQEVFATATAYAIGAGREIGDDDLLLSFKTLAKQIKTAPKGQPRVGEAAQAMGFVHDGGAA